MLRKLQKRVQAYMDRNMRSYNNVWKKPEQLFPDIAPIEEPIQRKLTAPAQNKLHVLVMHDDDITPIEYVAAVLKKCLEISEWQALDVAHKVHSTGACQVFAGDKSVLEDIAEHMTKDAHSRKFPLRFTVEKV